MSLSNPTADEIIAATDEALEADNRHEESAFRLWNAVKPHIQAGRRRAAARALADSIDSSWEDYLENVTS
jgi:hypothetical protein